VEEIRRRLDDVVYARARAADTEEEYHSYLEQYPSGVHVGEVRSRLEALAYAQVQAADTEEGYRTYLSEYPSGAHEEEARAALSRLARVRDMILVPSGWFLMGLDRGDVDERPQHPVYVDGFYIDQYEVTVAQYQACVAAGQCREPGKGRNCNWEIGGRGTHPINCVSWEDAQAFCAWQEKRLPTEAEWEKAARGTDGRSYPWGEEMATCDRVVMAVGGSGCGEGRTWPVGSRPSGASAYGVFDMAGNVWEWVWDWYGSGYYARGEDQNPQGPSGGSRRVLRGGSWKSANAQLLRVSNRRMEDPTLRLDFNGFRCAHDQ
jgi:formylglycine-generating enzyme required for sulfatase activity